MAEYQSTAQEQLAFLDSIQRLLAEGDFTATYKFALLLAIADLSVEHPADETTGTLTLHIEAIAEKYIHYYWGHAAPYPASRDITPAPLYQSTKGQAAVINLLAKHQHEVSPKLGPSMTVSSSWNQLIRKTANIIVEHPLWRLQVVGKNAIIPFLYENRELGTHVSEITLLPGIAHHFRHFHGLITNLVQSAWILQLHRIKKNAPIIGTNTDLREFLFGSDRKNLEIYRPLLTDFQSRKCFYCGRDVKDKGEVDHFIPWSRYPIDLGHNFVLAHASCNNSKRDFIADTPHLENWLMRNCDNAASLTNELDTLSVQHDLNASLQITRWAYQQTAQSNGLFWQRKDTFVDATGIWKEVFEKHPCS